MSRGEGNLFKDMLNAHSSSYSCARLRKRKKKIIISNQKWQNSNIRDITYFVTDFEPLLFYRTSYRNVSSGARGPSHNNSVTPRADNLVPPTLHPHPSLNITSASPSSHIIISHLTISHNRIPPPPRKSTPSITPQCEVHILSPYPKFA